MQLELAQALARQCHQAGVMGARGDLGEENLLPADEQLHPEQAPAAQRRGHALGHLLGPFQGHRAQGLRLPGLHIVPVDLPVPDRLAEARHRLPGAGMTPAHREQRDLGVETHEALHDDPASVHAPVGRRVAPGRLQVLRPVRHRLAVARRGHDRFDHARKAHSLCPCLQLVQGRGEGVGTGRQSQLLGSQASDALTIHRQLHCTGGRYHLHLAGALQRRQGVGGQRLDLRDHDGGTAGADGGRQRLGVAHVHRHGVVRHLLGRSPLIAVDRRDLHPQAGQSDRHLLADLTGAQQRHLRRAAGPGRTQHWGGGPTHRRLLRRALA